MCSFSQVHTQEYQQTHRHTDRQIQIQPNTFMETHRDKNIENHTDTRQSFKKTHTFSDEEKMRQQTDTQTDVYTYDHSHKPTHTQTHTHVL